MKRFVASLLALAFASLPLEAAQLYRWVDDKGNVEWRDTPPPPTAKSVEQRTIGASTIQTTGIPYSVKQAMKDFPVTLWTTNCGQICNQARAHLARRGVPYKERNPRVETDAFKKATGGMEVPVLIVGSSRLKGYLESDWDGALNSAGYPKEPFLGYKAPPPVADPKPVATAQPQP